MTITETSVCTFTYFSYFHCEQKFITNRFCQLVPKFVPKRSVHKIFQWIALTLYKLKDIHNQVCVMNAVMATECSNLIIVTYQARSLTPSLTQLPHRAESFLKSELTFS